MALGGSGIVVLGHVVHDTLACTVRMRRKAAELSPDSQAAEVATLRERAGRLGAVPLAAQAAGAPSYTTPLGDAIERRRAAVRAEAATPVPQGERPDRPEGRVRPPVAFVQGAVAGGTAPGSVLSRTRMSEMLAPARIAEMVRCIDGGCDAARCRFAPTPCTMCTRSLHVAECGRFGSGRAAMGLFTCHYCRAREMAPSREPTPELLRSATQSMVLELSLGAESTAASVAQYNRLEADFASGEGSGG